MAHATLRLLLDLTRHAPLRAVFLSGSLPPHSAHLVLHLLTQMLGERAQVRMQSSLQTSDALL